LVTPDPIAPSGDLEGGAGKTAVSRKSGRLERFVDQVRVSLVMCDLPIMAGKQGEPQLSKTLISLC
jgi:hypothetical protein